MGVEEGLCLVEKGEDSKLPKPMEMALYRGCLDGAANTYKQMEEILPRTY